MLLPTVSRDRVRGRFFRLGHELDLLDERCENEHDRYKGNTPYLQSSATCTEWMYGVIRLTSHK